MKFALPIASLVALVSSTAVDLAKRDSPLDLSIAQDHDTVVKLSLTNSGSESYKLFTPGSFLDASPVKKLQVSGSSAEAPFSGIMKRILYTDLAEEEFRSIDAGETIEVEIEIAELYDVESETYEVLANGALAYAEPGSNELIGALSFSSNKISLDVDGEKAKTVSKAINRMREKRTVLGSDCTGSQRSAVTRGLSNCATLASRAATAARSGSGPFNALFKSTSTSVRNEVAGRLNAIASDCSSTTSGPTETHCTDTYRGCSSNVLAYTVPALDYFVYCPIFFNGLPAIPNRCYGQDQATTVLHEEAHAPGVYSPGTVDNGYGFSAATQLSTSQALRNADSFALYATGVYLGC